MNTVECPYCREAISNDKHLAGQVVSCPYCSQQLRMPPPAAVPIAAKPPTPKPVTVGPVFPNAQPASTKPSTTTNRYRKRKTSIPVWGWVVGGISIPFVFCCCIPAMIGSIAPKPPQPYSPPVESQSTVAEPSRSSRYSDYQLDRAKAELESRGIRDVDDRAAESLLDLEAIMN